MERPSLAARAAALALLVAAVALTCSHPMNEGFVEKVKESVAAAVAAPRVLTLGGDGNGIVANSGEVEIKDGIAFSVSATPFSSHVFGQWTKAGGTGTVVFADAAAASTTVTVTGGDAEIRANFEARPKVYYSTPTGNGIYTNTYVTVYFSKDMDKSSVESPGAIQLLRSGSAPVAATVTLVNPTTAKIVPAANLNAQCYFVIQVSRAVTDADLNTMEDDYSGNFRTASTSDVTAPTSPEFNINSVNPAFVATRSVTLTDVIASDEGEITEICVVENGADPVSLGYAQTIEYTLSSPGDGLKTLTVYAVDSVGNANPLDNATQTVTLDSTAPSGSFSVAASTGADAGYVRDSTLTLQCAMTDGGVSMTGAKCRWSTNEGSTPVWSDWSDYAASVSGVAFPTASQGTKVARLQVKDSLENTGEFSYSFTYDSVAPAFPSFTLDGSAAYTTTGTVAMALSSTDSGSGLWRMEFSPDGTWAEAWESYAATDSWGFEIDGNQTVHARVKDRAGNISTNSDAITVDRGIPAVTAFSIAGGAAYATASEVALSETYSDPVGPGSVAGTGVEKMRFSVDGIAWSEWEDKAESKASFTLPSGDGAKTVWIQVRDYAGNVSLPAARSDSIILDTAPPTVSAFAIVGTGDGTNNYVNSAWPSVTMTVDSEAGSPISVRFDNGGGWTAWTDWAAWKTTHTVNLGADGLKTLTYELKDDCYGGTVRTDSRAITVDTVPPTSTHAFQVTSQPNPSYVAGSQVLNSTVPADTWKVRYFIAGTLVSTVTAAPFSLTWNTTGYANGTAYALVAEATDHAGNVHTSATLTRTVDNVAPTAAAIANITYSGTNASYLKGTQAVTATATDAIGVGKVEYYIAGVLKASSTAGPTYPMTWDTTTYTSGTAYAVTCKVYDYAGNNITSASAIRTVDNVAPTSSSFSVGYSGSDPNWVRSACAVTATAADAVGIGKVEFYINGSLAGTDAVSPFAYTWATTGYATGTSYPVYCKAFDYAGNSLDSATASYTVDNVAPTCTVTATTVAGPSVRPSATASDANSGVYNVAFTANGTSLGSDTTATYQAPNGWNVTALTEGGGYTVSATATDLAGNTSTGSATFTVDNYTLNSIVTVPDLGTADGSTNYGYSAALVGPTDMSPLFLAYLDQTNWDLDFLTSTDYGATWTETATQLSSSGSATSKVALAMSSYSQTTVYAAYVGSSTLSFAVTRDSGATWTTTASLATAGQSESRPVIKAYYDSASATVHLHVAWIYYTGTNYYLYYKHGADNGTTVTWDSTYNLLSAGTGHLLYPSGAVNSEAFYATVFNSSTSALYAASRVAVGGAALTGATVVDSSGIGPYGQAATLAIAPKGTLIPTEYLLLAAGSSSGFKSIFKVGSGTPETATVQAAVNSPYASPVGNSQGLITAPYDCWNVAYFNGGDLFLGKSYSTGSTMAWYSYRVENLTAATQVEYPAIVSGNGDTCYIVYFDDYYNRLRCASFTINF